MRKIIVNPDVRDHVLLAIYRTALILCLVVIFLVDGPLGDGLFWTALAIYLSGLLFESVTA
jgi:hypothetical protein